MKIKNISWGSFFIGAAAGLLLGILALGMFVNYLISRALSGAPTDGQFLGSAISQVREGIANGSETQKTQAAYGHVISNQNGTLTLTVYWQNKDQNMSFAYDAATKFVTLANDTASSELPLSSDAIAAGDRVTVYTNEPIGSASNQHAVKVIKY